MPSRGPAGFLTIFIAASIWLGQALPVSGAGDVTPSIRTYGSGPSGPYVGVSGSPATIASLYLPLGMWLVTGKATFTNLRNVPRTVRCSLIAGGPVDTTWAGLAGGASTSLMSHLVKSVTAANGSVVLWRCFMDSGSPGDVDTGWIRLTAMQVGTFTSVDIETGTRSTIGSALPKVVSGYLGGPTDVPENDDPHSIASLDLSRGSWIILAKATVKDTDVFPIQIDCRLKPTHDSALIYLGRQGSGLERGSLAWQGVAALDSADSLELVCESSGALGDAVMYNLRITALRVDDVFVKLLPTTATSSKGAQVFWHDAQRKTRGSEYFDAMVPNGNWVVLVTAVTYDPFSDSGGLVDCHIYEDAGDVFIRDVSLLSVRPANTGGSQGVMSLSAAGAIDEQAGSARIEIGCKSEFAGTYAGGRASYIRIVFLRGTSIVSTGPG